MIKKLVRHGNSLALIIDKPILELLHIDAETELELSTDGHELKMRPTDLPHQVVDHARRVKSALAGVNQRHGTALKKLAE